MKLLPGASSIILRSTPCSNWVKEQNHALIVKWAPQLLKYKNLKALLIQGNLSTLVLKSNQQVRNQESILGKNWNMSSLLKPSFFWGCELWTFFVSGTPLEETHQPTQTHHNFSSFTDAVLNGAEEVGSRKLNDAQTSVLTQSKMVRPGAPNPKDYVL